MWDITSPNLALPRMVERPPDTPGRDRKTGRNQDLAKRVEALRRLVKQPSEPAITATSRSERWLAAAYGDTLHIMDGDDANQPPETIPVGGEISGLFFSGDEKQMAAVVNGADLGEGIAHLVDLQIKVVPGRLLRQRDGIRDLVWCPDGIRIATAGEDFEAHIWNRHTGHHLMGPLMHPHQVMSLSFSSDGRVLATLAWNGLPRLWDSFDGIALTPEKRGNLEGVSISFSEDNKALRILDKSGRHWICDVLREHRPLKDLATLSKLLAGLYDSPGEPHDPVAIYGTLKQSYPAQFSSQAGQRLEWHRMEHARLAAAGREKAAAFHKQVIERIGVHSR